MGDPYLVFRDLHRVAEDLNSCVARMSLAPTLQRYPELVELVIVARDAADRAKEAERRLVHGDDS